LLPTVKSSITLKSKNTILDKDLELVGSYPYFGHFKHLKSSNKFAEYKLDQNKILIYDLSLIPWYNRISAETYMIISLVILGMLLLIFVLWIFTMRLSLKKIHSQKIEIERSHNELEAATSKLIHSEKLAVLGTIASGVAHEINSPLGAIINSSERLTKLNDVSKTSQKNIELIRKASLRCKSIVEKFLLSSRDSNGDKSSNVDEVINDWLELFKKQFELQGIEIQTKVDKKAHAAIPSTELNQIITNIMFNARDSIIDSHSEEKRINVFAELHNKDCIITISDTGSGFSEEKLHKPFQIFNTTKELGKEQAWDYG
jgi:signal transduction histidine kinase